MSLLPDALARAAAVVAGLLACAGLAVLLAGGGDGAIIAGGALLAIAGVIAVSLAFYAIGASEDRDRRHGLG